MGVIARSELPAAPALRAAFERFGIPARFYYAPALISDPTVRYLLAVVDAALSGWDYELTLEALRASGSPLEFYGDKWEHNVRNHLPAAGLAGLRALAADRSVAVFDALEPLSAWSSQSDLPSAWARQFGSLAKLVQHPRVHDHARPETIERWRQQAAALQHFQAAVTETAAALDAATAISCSEFLNALRAVLRSASVRLVDHRRDVVHVIDAVEARQWRLPVVFVCGLLESQFPKHHSEDPILSDNVRRKLQSAGVSVKTSTDRQEDEQALFDVVLTRATQHLYLSYAQLNAKGDPNLPSFYLERAKPWTADESVPARPTPAYARAAEPEPSIYSEELRTRLASKYSVISPSHVETYLQCPYQAFARYTLRLKPSPGDPWERFDRLTQGSIAHRVFERHYRDGVSVREAFNETFEAFAQEKRLPEGYRTEAIRLELLNGVELLAADSRLRRTAPTSLFEHEFTVDLGEGTTARGRIDRLDVDEMNNAVVFDYKYRRKTGIRESVRDNEDGTKVQGGLYLLGARSLGYLPAGMVYCGFRKEVSVGGWVVAPLYPHLGSSCSRDHLVEVMQTAQQEAIRVATDIREGRIRPEPEDSGKCDWCEFASICRIETVRAGQTRSADAAE
jgi:ATP-dependent helicase/DNAse subunit B